MHKTVGDGWDGLALNLHRNDTHSTENRRRYVVRDLLDLVIIALPLLRPLRLLRFVSLLNVLNRRASTGLCGRLAIYVAGGSALMALCGALAVLDAERGNPARTSRRSAMPSGGR
jgi:hypothetical protein